MVLPALEFSRICFFVVCYKNKERKIYFTLEQFRHLEQFLFWKKRSVIVLIFLRRAVIGQKIPCLLLSQAQKNLTLLYSLCAW